MLGGKSGLNSRDEARREKVLGALQLHPGCWEGPAEGTCALRPTGSEGQPALFRNQQVREPCWKHVWQRRGTAEGVSPEGRNTGRPVRESEQTPKGLEAMWGFRTFG